jgi:hypothetical protein
MVVSLSLQHSSPERRLAVIARLHALSSALWHERSGATATEYAPMDLVSQRVEERLRARELDKRVIDGPFAPEGECPWCDWRRGWVRRQPKPKRAVQRKKRSRSGMAV